MKSDEPPVGTWDRVKNLLWDAVANAFRTPDAADDGQRLGPAPETSEGDSPESATPAEAEVLAACREGRWADFGDEQQWPDGAVLDATFLRRLFVGLAESGAPSLPLGLRLRGATIEGGLDLRDASGAQGGPCPPLVLEDCVLSGDGSAEDPSSRPAPSLDARQAHFGRFSLRRCKIGYLDLSGAKLDGDLRLEALQSPDPQGLCWVRARGIHLRGAMRLDGSRLRLYKADEGASEKDRHATALDLSEAQIGGTLFLDKGFVAEGSVRLHSARIRGSLRALGARLSAQEQNALIAEGVQIDGHALLGSDERKGRILRFHAEGSLGFYGARIGGSLDFRGSRLEHKGSPQGNALVLLPLAKVGGDLRFLHAQVEAGPRGPAADVPFESEGSISFWHTQVAGKTTVQGRVAHLMAERSHFESHVELEGVLGDVVLNSCRIDGRLSLQGTGTRVFAPALRVVGNTELSGRFRQTLRFEDAHFQGHLVFNATVVQPWSAALEPLRGAERTAGIQLDNAKLDRDLTLNQIEPRALRHWAHAEGPRVRRRVLSCFPGWWLGECLCPAPKGEELSLLNFLAEDDGEGLVLFSDGPSLRQHPPVLDTEEQRLDYLRFYTGLLWTRRGSFVLVESADDLLESRFRDAVPEIDPVRWRDDEPGNPEEAPEQGGEAGVNEDTPENGGDEEDGGDEGDGEVEGVELSEAEAAEPEGAQGEAADPVEHPEGTPSETADEDVAEVPTGWLADTWVDYSNTLSKVTFRLSPEGSTSIVEDERVCRLEPQLWVRYPPHGTDYGWEGRSDRRLTSSGGREWPLPPTVRGTWEEVEEPELRQVFQRLVRADPSWMGDFGWCAERPTAARWCNLSFYPGWRLVEARFDRSGTDLVAVVAFLVRGRFAPKLIEGGDLVLLGGISNPIHRLNQEHGLVLDTDHQRVEYLRFFCSHVWAQAPFQIVDHVDRLPPGFDPGALELVSLDLQEQPTDAAQLPTADSRVESRGRTWQTPSTIAYLGHFFEATLLLEEGGMVQMLDDQPLGVTYEMPYQVKAPARVYRSDPSSPESWPGAPLTLGDWRPIPERWLGRLGERLTVVGKRALNEVELNLHRCKAGALVIGDADGLARVVPRLDGFEYGWIDPSRSLTPEEPDTKPLASATGQSASADQFEGSRRTAATIRVSWQLILGWLEDRYRGTPGRPRARTYSPQPYEHLAMVLRRQGEVEGARQVTVSRLRLERRIPPTALRERVKRVFSWPFSLAFDAFFLFGLSPARGILTFLLCWVLGIYATDLANFQQPRMVPSGVVASYDPAASPPILVVDVDATSAIDDGPDTSPPKSLPPGLAEEIHCGERIEPAIYALDVFVPLVELAHERRCSISTREEARPWRFAKAGYRVLGWIVTSLLVASLAGVFRRHFEG